MYKVFEEYYRNLDRNYLKIIFSVIKFLQKIFLNSFDKSKTKRNSLYAMDIQFLYGRNCRSTVRQPKFPVELQFFS